MYTCTKLWEKKTGGIVQHLQSVNISSFTVVYTLNNIYHNEFDLCKKERTYIVLAC